MSQRMSGRGAVGKQISVLVVEDEPEIADLICFHVEREGFETRVACTGSAAIEAVEAQVPDIILLDILLPDFDGLDVCRRLKGDAETARIPIVIVSAMGEEADVIAGLELGADDYVTKPFRPRVLMARLRAVLRRHNEEDSARKRTADRIELGKGILALDAEKHEVWLGGKEVDLTITEFRLLEYLAQRPGFVQTRDQIVSAIRGEGTVLSSRAIDVHIASLRRKLGEAGGLVETVRGVGYRVTAENDTPA